MTGIIDLTAVEIAQRFVEGQLSAVDTTRAFLERIEATDADLHAWVHLNSTVALARALAVDQARAQGRVLGPMAGVPFGVKDIFNTIDFPTEMGSVIWKNFTPGNDARVIYDLRYRGGVVLGKTATAEFAVHQLGETLHPRDGRRNPGTSSSGSAVAVASGQAPVALGTQTAGSIIRPASYCGIYGFKPSFGLIPRTAMLKTTDSLDTVGFMARGAADLRLVFDVVRVKGRDFPISHAALSDVARQTKPVTRPWRVGVVKPHTWQNTHPYARELFDREMSRWSDAGLEIVEVSVPQETRAAHEVHAMIYERTLSYYFAEEAKRKQLISAVLNGMISRGRTITLDQYKGALAQQSLIARKMDEFLGGFDALVTLSVAGEAPLRDEEERPDSCLVWTLCGLPAINVPALSGPNRLPVGVQLVGRRYNDYLLLSLLDHLVELGLAPRASERYPT